jgi:hypothetical protein
VSRDTSASRFCGTCRHHSGSSSRCRGTWMGAQLHILHEGLTVGDDVGVPHDFERCTSISASSFCFWPILETPMIFMAYCVLLRMDSASTRTLAAHTDYLCLWCFCILFSFANCYFVLLAIFTMKRRTAICWYGIFMS